MSDSDYSAVELYSDYSDSLLMIASVCCVISMTIGIPGNLITIVALAKFKKVHNATAVFIINMSCADLLLLCLDPPLATATYWSRSWTRGRVSCQLYALAKCILVSTSIFTVVAITINRYILIVYPRLYFKIYRTRNLTIMLAAIWIAPLLALMPTYLGIWSCFGLDLDYGPCSLVPDQNKRSSKKILFISVLGLPCIPIILCYSRIFFIVRKTTKKLQIKKPSEKTRTTSLEETMNHDSSPIIKLPVVTINNSDDKGECVENSELLILETPRVMNNDKEDKVPGSVEPPRVQRNILKRSIRFLKLSLPRRKDKRLGTMILAIMTSFCICYLPSVITALLHGITPHPVLTITSHVLLWFSCCLNPVIYVAMSNEYQKAYRNLFKHRIFIKESLSYFCGFKRASISNKRENM